MIQKFTGLVLVILMLAGYAQAAPPVVTDVTLTDVTPKALSVTWNSSQAAVPSLRIFSDSNGTNEVTGQFSMTLNPLRGGADGLKTVSQQDGIMQVKISGLAAGTTYYVQTMTMDAATGEVTYWPAAGPFTAVTTMQHIEPMAESGGSEYLFPNDLVRLTMAGGRTPWQDGMIVALDIPGAAYPVTGVVGDTAEAPSVTIDLNNMFSGTTADTLLQQGGEHASVTTFLGVVGIENSSGYLLPASGMAKMSPTFDLAEVIKALAVLTGRQDITLAKEYDTNDNQRIGAPDGLFFFRAIGDN